MHTFANRASACSRAVLPRPNVIRSYVPAFFIPLRVQCAHQGAHIAAPAWPHVQPRRRAVAIVSRSFQASEANLEAIPSDVKLEVDKGSTAKEVTYDEASKTIKIPLAAMNDGQRRTKMVMFTCNKCGGRSARLINPVAWEKGAVFCQCQHCGVWHTLRAAKHIIEEVRYNEPEWDLNDPQWDLEDFFTLVEQEPEAGEDGAEDAMQEDGSDVSSQSELALPSDIMEDQATSDAQDDTQTTTVDNSNTTQNDNAYSIPQTDSYTASHNTISAQVDSSSSSAAPSSSHGGHSGHSSHSTAPDTTYSSSNSHTSAHNDSYTSSHNDSHSTSSYSYDTNDSYSDSGDCGGGDSD
eukprot:GHUV01001883.1.p1 GENE.GHUV01001883.1~~GHUV01001883.1.p1  ORF type:complete len:378 (+),score=71.33 GHUV01001883.1:84-1136(+)